MSLKLNIKMKLAVVGATGLVGQEVLKVLEERAVSFDELYLVASAKSVGQKIKFKGKEYTIIGMEEAVALAPDVAIFSAGGGTSLEWAPKFAAVGTTVIDNSSAWRMDSTKKLIVPEINGHELGTDDLIIANPNCSTIQMVMALAPLHTKYKIKRIVVSTYQSISGAGQKGLNQLHNEQLGIYDPTIKHPIHSNAIFHPVSTEDSDWTVEEIKMIKETRKILHLPDLAITVTCVRLPIEVGHSEAVFMELKENTNVAEIKNVFTNSKGIVVMDNLQNDEYPTPVMTEDRDEVFIGRIRKDPTITNGFWFWVVANNVRKGAASNAIQIAEGLI